MIMKISLRFLTPISSSPAVTAPYLFPPRARTIHLSRSFSTSTLISTVDDGKPNQKTLLKGMSYTDLEKWVQSHGFRPGQALMLWKRLYGNNIWAHTVEELQGLNKDFKAMLDQCAEFKALVLKDVHTASDGTKKILFTLEDGLVIETVLIPCDGGRTTVCVSSQVGCAMNCQFCYTGRMGLKRNLTAAEIVEQAVFARRLFSGEVGPITNVVFMGMGEPLQNIDHVIKAAGIMVHDQGLHFSPRKVTVSTSGLVPQLKRFLHESNCALAVSLNATTDEVRNWIMPINRKYNLSLLLSTLREELPRKHNYKVLFEYVMLAGINDSIEDAERLINLVEGIPCKINLISFNPHCGSQFKPTSDEKMIEFRNILAEAGCVVLLRPSRGDDKMAACGQLGKLGELQIVMPRLGWRWLLGLSSLPSLSFLVFYSLIAESPRYLCMKGRTGEAYQVLKEIALLNRTKLPPGKLVSDEPATSDNDKLVPSEHIALISSTKSYSSTVFVLFSSKLIKTTLLLWVVYFGNTFAYYGVVLLTSELSSGQSQCGSHPFVAENNSDSYLYINVFVTSCAELPGLALAAIIVDKVGRKCSMEIMILVGFALLLPLVSHQNKIVTTTLLFGARMFISASFIVACIYAPEVYPTSVRSTGVGVATAVGRVGGMICPLVAVALVSGCHQGTAIVLFEVVLLLVGVCVMLFPFETTGKELTDVVLARKEVPVDIVQ